jgi:hypothetical protein
MSIQYTLPEILFPAPAQVLPLGDDLWHYPHVSCTVLQARAKAVGLAGEQLTDSLLTRWGLYSLPFPECAPADRMVMHPDWEFRLQVKTCTNPTNGSYRFTMKKGYQRSPGGTRPYAPHDFAMAALVVLPKNAVYFTAERRNSYQILEREIPALQAAPRDSFEEALAHLGLPAPKGGSLRMH